ncbi:MAG: hypothetical protein Kow0080_26110 [Candidatus Promineifilaceae bacterium]
MAKILVVEDDSVIQRILTMRLQQWGYEVLIAGDGETAVTLAATQKPDLIFMDLRLPIMDGWEATRRIKDNDTTNHIPVSLPSPPPAPWTKKYASTTQAVTHTSPNPSPQKH